MINIHKLISIVFIFWYLFCIYLSIAEHASMAHFVVDNIVNLLIITYFVFLVINKSNNTIYLLGSFIIGILIYYLYIDMITPTATPGIWMSYAIFNIACIIFIVIHQYPYLVRALKDSIFAGKENENVYTDNNFVFFSMKNLIIYSNILTAIAGFSLLKALG